MTIEEIELDTITHHAILLDKVKKCINVYKNYDDTKKAFYENTDKIINDFVTFYTDKIKNNKTNTIDKACEMLTDKLVMLLDYVLQSGLCRCDMLPTYGAIPIIDNALKVINQPFNIADPVFFQTIKYTDLARVQSQFLKEYYENKGETKENETK